MKELFQFVRFAIILFLVAQTTTPAQALHPVPSVPDCPPATGAPIDGGASLLLAGGAAYAVRRIRKGRAA